MVTCMVTAGSVQECTYHYVTSTETKPKDEFRTVKGNFEILNGGGIIANGEPHIHITLSSPDKARLVATWRRVAGFSTLARSRLRSILDLRLSGSRIETASHYWKQSKKNVS